MSEMLTHPEGEAVRLTVPRDVAGELEIIARAATQLSTRLRRLAAALTDFEVAQPSVDAGVCVLLAQEALDLAALTGRPPETALADSLRLVLERMVGWPRAAAVPADGAPGIDREGPVLPLNRGAGDLPGFAGGQSQDGLSEAPWQGTDAGARMPRPPRP